MNTLTSNMDATQSSSQQAQMLPELMAQIKEITDRVVRLSHNIEGKADDTFGIEPANPDLATEPDIAGGVIYELKGALNSLQSQVEIAESHFARFNIL